MGLGHNGGGRAMTHMSGSRQLKVVMKMEVGLLAVLKRADGKEMRRRRVGEGETFSGIMD